MAGLRIGKVRHYSGDRLLDSCCRVGMNGKLSVSPEFPELTTLQSPDYQTEAVPGNTGLVFGEYTFGTDTGP